MKIYPLNRALYDEICELMDLVKKKGVFKKYDSSKIIMIKTNDVEGALTFVRDTISGNYGLSFFVGKDGINSLHDMLTLDDLSYSITAFNLINVVYKKEELFEESDYVYFKKRKIQIRKLKNIVLNTYKEGYAMYVSTNDEAKKVIELLKALYVILNNKGADVDEAFKDENNAILAEIDFDKLTLSITVDELPYLEVALDETQATEEEVLEFKSLEYANYDLDIMTRGSGIAVRTKECNVSITPLLVTLNTEEMPLDRFDMFLSTPNEYRGQLLYILKEYFVEKGLPKSININNRKIYYQIKNLVSRLGIDIYLKLENPKYDSLLEDINYALYTSYPFTIRDQELMSAKEEDLRKTSNLIKELLDAFKNDKLFSIDEAAYSDPTIKKLLEIINESVLPDDGDDIDDNNENSFVS